MVGDPLGVLSGVHVSEHLGLRPDPRAVELRDGVDGGPIRIAAPQGRSGSCTYSNDRKLSSFLACAMLAELRILMDDEVEPTRGKQDSISSRGVSRRELSSSGPWSQSTGKRQPALDRPRIGPLDAGASARQRS
jgi:hypothetical protein